MAFKSDEYVYLTPKRLLKRNIPHGLVSLNTQMSLLSQSVLLLVAASTSEQELLTSVHVPSLLQVDVKNIPVSILSISRQE